MSWARGCLPYDSLLSSSPNNRVFDYTAEAVGLGTAAVHDYDRSAEDGEREDGHRGKGHARAATLSSVTSS